MAQNYITDYDVANFENNPKGILAEITGLDPESISGFEGSGVELGIDGSVTKGAITLNANEIPSSIIGIEYDQDNQNIILTYENGGKVSIAQGTLTENNKLTGVTNGEVEYGDIDLNVDNAGTINVNKDGVMEVSGEASANIEDKEFSSGTFQKLGEDTFDIKGKVKFGDTDIETNAPVEIKFQDDTTTTSTTTTTTSTDDPPKGKNSVIITNREGGVGVTGDLDGDNAKITVDAPPGTGIEVNVGGAVVNTLTEDAKNFDISELEPAPAAPNGENIVDGPPVEGTASEEVTEYRIGRRGRIRRNRVGREYERGRPGLNVAIAVGRVGRGLRGGVGRVGKGAGRVVGKVGKGVGKVGKGAAIVAGRAGRGVLRFAGRAGRVVKNIRPGRAVVNIFRRSRERHGPVERLIFKRLRRV